MEFVRWLLFLGCISGGLKLIIAATCCDLYIQWTCDL